MKIIIGLLIIAGIFCIYKVIKELKKSMIIDLTQEDYEEY
jgi:uncharacterized membrane protein YqjE